MSLTVGLLSGPGYLALVRFLEPENRQKTCALRLPFSYYRHLRSPYDFR